MPKLPSPENEFRPRIVNGAPLILLAALNRRRPVEEANIAVDRHLAKNRAKLKAGPKLKH